jgi:phosphatidylserine/phosphatidylglycerophosphate/cardiolipin synthase-like enzyme
LYNSPEIDRRIQTVLLHVLSALTINYGFRKIDLSEIETTVNTLVTKNFSFGSVSQKQLEAYINKFKNYGLSIEITGKEITTEQFSLQENDPDLAMSEEQIEDILGSVLKLHTPIYLNQQLSQTQEALTQLAQNQVQFLATSKIQNKRDISEKLATMINEAKQHVYIMLAFYEEDVSFLANFLSNKVLNSQLDLRIIYNPKDKKNRDFIRKMHCLMNQQKTDFFRVYHPEYIKDIGEGKFIGNLHSKAVVTENALLVGSANLTAMSLYYNIETALYTNDMKSVEQANEFFVNLWNRLSIVGAI